jgi:hypothetical protein
MSFNINTFKSETFRKGEFQRASKFEVTITPPTSLNANGYERTLTYRCESVVFPGISTATHQVHRYGYGPYEKKPYNSIYTDVNMTVLGDEKGAAWGFFKRWNDLVFNSGAGDSPVAGAFEVGYKDQYRGGVVITTFDNKGEKSNAVELKEAYPIFVGDMRFDWGATNQIIKIPVTITFWTYAPV